jgi:hypothetical protein
VYGAGRFGRSDFPGMHGIGSGALLIYICPTDGGTGSLGSSTRRVRRWLQCPFFQRNSFWAALDPVQSGQDNAFMTRICTVLVLLLLVLTFNAYACVFPLPPQSGMDCSSTAEQPVRQPCDAFLELGPQSQASSSHELLLHKILDFEAAPQLPTSLFLVFHPEHPPRGSDTPIHLSIPTTVLRI